MFKAFFLLLVLTGVWVALSGFLTPFFIGVGVASCLVSVIIAYNMSGKAFARISFFLNWRAPFYLIWLIKQIIVGGLDVTKRIWQLDPDIGPMMRWVPSTQETDFGRMVYANSITLTPGTVSVLVRDNKIQVHGLVQENIDDLIEGAMDRFVTEMTSRALSPKKLAQKAALMGGGRSSNEGGW